MATWTRANSLFRDKPIKKNKDVHLSQILSLNCPNFDLSMVPLAPPCAATWSLAQTGVSENSVPLNPMVLLIIIPIEWL